MPSDYQKIVSDFNKIGKSVQGPMFRKAARAAMVPTYKEILNKTPIAKKSYRPAKNILAVPGYLRRATRLSVSVAKYNVGARIWIKKEVSYIYTNFLAQGTSAHDIPKQKLSGRGGSWRKKALKINGRFVKKVKHPGIKPNPYIQRTFSMNGSKIEAELATQLAKQIHKSLK